MVAACSHQLPEGTMAQLVAFMESPWPLFMFFGAVLWLAREQ